LVTLAFSEKKGTAEGVYFNLLFSGKSSENQNAQFEKNTWTTRNRSVGIMWQVTLNLIWKGAEMSTKKI